MKKEPMYLWNYHFKAVIGIGVWIDRYNKEDHGIQGHQYYVVLPFLTLTFTKLYPSNHE